MNSTTLSHPRLRCRAVRFWSALTEREPARHLQDCPDCRRYFAASAELQARLTRTKAAAPAAVPADLERGILRAVASARAEEAAAGPAQRRPAPAHLARWLTGGGIAIAAAAAVAMMMSSRDARVPSPHPTSLGSDDVTALIDSAAKLSDQWWNTVVPSASTALQKNPLQQEAASMYAAAQSALDFLALNFLPPTETGTTPPGVAPRPAGTI